MFDDGFRLPVLIILAAMTIKANATAQSAPLQPTPDSGTQTVGEPSSSGTIATSPPSQEAVGDSLAVHQRYQAAIAAYAKSENRTAAIWNKMGVAYQMMFNLKEAIRCYNESLKLEPHNSQVINNLATVFDSQKQYKQAEHYYHKALKYNSHSALILRNLGSNLLAQHKYKKGWEAYRSAATIDPEIFQQQSGASVQNPTSVQDRGALHYYMAKGCVTAGNAVCAIDNLRRAMNEGFTTAKKVSADDSFASLRDLPAFQELITAQTAQ